MDEHLVLSSTTVSYEGTTYLVELFIHATDLAAASIGNEVLSQPRIRILKLES